MAHRAPKMTDGQPARWLLSRILYPLDKVSFGIAGPRHTVGSLLVGAPVIILRTTGARTGNVRAVPPSPDGDNVLGCHT